MKELIKPNDLIPDNNSTIQSYCEVDEGGPNPCGQLDCICFYATVSSNVNEDEILF